MGVKRNVGKSEKINRPKAKQSVVITENTSKHPSQVLFELFEQQAAETPENIALIFADRTLSYQEVNRQANLLANHLLDAEPSAERHDSPLAAILLERSPEMVIAVLATLKTGKAYVPVDPNYPPERVRQILASSGAAFLLTRSPLLSRLSLSETVPDCQAVCLDAIDLSSSSAENPSVPCSADELAYVIFTSGSTGQPKGVMINHLGAVNTVQDINERFHVTEQDRVLALSSLSFDLSVYDIFGILSSGGAVVIPEPESDKDPAYWVELMQQHQVTLWNTVPALMGLLTDYLAFQPEAAPASLRLVMMSGDWIPLSLPERIRELWPNACVMSLGGATEASIWSICYQIGEVNPSWKSIPYGRALRNQAVDVLDEQMNICPPSVPGHLYIGGIGVAMGYWQDAERTAASFITHPQTGERLYRTGDLGVYLPDGNIEFIGREDTQVKIRGFRVELGEIEAALQRHSAVGAAAVKVFGTGDNKSLAAYFTAQIKEKSKENQEQGAEELIEQWQEIFDETYSESAAGAGRGFNIVGWNSSYTGLPIAAAEMKEWLDGTVAQIMSLAPKRVLEIGCGTGMLLFRIAPNCQHYTGIDISQKALHSIEEQISDWEAAAKITLIQSAADNLDSIAPGSADTVVINSVIQYFPSVQYLITVLTKAIAATAPGGAVFIGDVRNFQLLEAFHASVQFHQADDTLPVAELKQRTAQSLQKERELLIDPDFFAALKHISPRIKQVRLHVKAGTAQNEMNKFRYDVTLHLDDEAQEEAAPLALDWQQEKFNLERTSQLLQENYANQPIVLTNIPNARLALEEQLAASFAQPEGTVQYLRERTAGLAQGIEPEALRQAAHGSPYRCHLVLSGSCTTYAAVFQPSGSLPRFAAQDCTAPRLWPSYANTPYQEDADRLQLPAELRAFIKKTLPDYMVPAAFILMEAMPLTPNGKIDRKALPEPELSSKSSEEHPLGPEEELLAELWADLLRCGAVGRSDNFFDLGGNSLLAMRLVSRIRESFQVELPLRAVFSNPQLKDLAAAIEQAAGTPCLPPISKKSAQDLEQLSFAQQRLWFLDQFDEQSNPAYNIPIALEMQGRLDLRLLEQSLRLMVERHASLRTCFVMQDGRPYTTIKQVEEMFALELHDLRSLNQDMQAAEVIRQTDAHAAAQFDLAQGPVFRTACLLLDEQRSVLLLNMHHVVSDGWSMAIFLRDWQETYTALSQNKESALPELTIEYPDYAAWQRSWLHGPILEQQVDYWRRELAGVPELLELPTDKPRPSRRSSQGGQHIRPLPPALSQSLADLSREQSSTLFMVLLAAFNVLLARHSGQNDICVGSPIAGRRHSQTEDLIGFFVNTLVLRAQTAPEQSFNELLRAVRRSCLSAYAHQDIPFEILVEELQPVRSMSHSPLFQVMFVLQNNEVPDLALPELKVNFLETGNSAAKFDLTLSVEGKGDQLLCRWEYAADLFEKETVARIAERFEILLQGIAADPRQSVSRLPMLTAAELEQLEQWSAPETGPAPDCTLLDLFERQAAASPDNVALIHKDEQLTYQQLDEQACRLAHCLLAIKTETSRQPLVAVALERSPLMIISVLAALKAGAAYVPVDPDYPAERIQRILEGSGANRLITHQRVADSLELPENVHALTVEQLDLAAFPPEKPAAATQPDDLAYIIFTSGSTGLPKGVAISHRGAANTILDINERFAVGQNDRVLALSSLSFDLSVYDIFGLLAAGGAVVMPEQEKAKEPTHWAELSNRHKVTVWNSVPALMQIHADHVEGQAALRPESLRLVMMSGDWIPLNLPERISTVWPQARVISLGGATEASIWSIWHPIDHVDPAWKSIPYGKALRNQSWQVLNSALEPCPVNVPGQLYIGGSGLARCYWNDEEKTAASFIVHPRAGERLYRTGDLGRWLPDGSIEFLGRDDFQVKIRGFRIELGEIEACLRQHPAVRDVVAKVWGGGGQQYLAAYVTADAAAPSLTAELKAAAQQALPDYMVPAYYCLLDALPLTANGKLDRNALPEPELTAEQEGLKPVSPDEELLAAVWAGLLNAEQISREDSFFERGGNSLLAMQLVSRIRETFQTELPVRAIFEHPTLREMAAVVRAAAGSVSLPPITAQPDAARKQLSFAQQRLWFLDQLEENKTAAYNMPLAFALTGGLNAVALEKSLHWLRQRHASLRTIFAAEDGRPRAELRPAEDAPCLQIADLRHLDGDVLEQEIVAQLYEHTVAPFDLASGPLFRAVLLRTEAERAVLLLNMHHIVSDGWSIGILLRDLQHAYAAFLNEEEPGLPPLALEYGDFAVWQRGWLQGEVLQRQVDYWKRQLDGIPDLLELPTDKARPARQSYRGAHYTHLLPSEISQAVADLSRQEGATVFMTLLAAFSILLSRYSRQDDICVGSPIASRTHRQTEDLVGFFVNTLVLRTHLEPEQSFSGLLHAVRQTCLAAYAYQDIPFEMLVEQLQPSRNMSHAPLFQVMLAVQDEISLELQGLEAKIHDSEYPIAKFDLTLFVDDSEGRLRCTWEYATDIFSEASIIRMSGHFMILLQGIAADPRQSVSRLPMLTAAELEQLEQWSAPETGPAPDCTLLDLFERQAAASPDNVALIHKDEQLTYQQLDEQACRLAHCLLAIKTETSRQPLVAVALERSPLMIISVLAALKAGAAYVPVDPDYPAERIQRILEGSGAGSMITHQRVADSLELPENVHALTVEQLDLAAFPPEKPAAATQPDDLAYIIFTSGSTGLPKGVAISHRGAANTILDINERFAVGQNDRVLALSSLSFDLSVYDIFGLLAAGGAVVMPEQEKAKEPTHWAELSNRHKVTVWNSVPALMQIHADHVEGQAALRPESLRLVMMSGDWIPLNLPERISTVWPQARVISLGGATEASIWSIWHPIDHVDPAWKSIPYGKALRNQSWQVLNSALEPCPVNVPGQLYIGGSGLARCYWNDEEKTATSFIIHPRAGERLYRTGDLGRWLPDGSIEFLGRDDFQVKIRGFRIELGEIEACLRQHPAVREALTAVHDEGDSRHLAAYFTASDPCLESGQLRTWLKERLPDYMVPNYLMPLKTFPLTANGKIDRKALPKPKLTFDAGDFSLPRNEIEQTLAEIWGALLKQRSIGIHDNFFELGGDSILSIQVVTRARKAGIQLAVHHLFEHQSIAELAKVAQAGVLIDIDAEQGLVSGELPLTPAQHWFFAQEQPEPHHFNQSVLLSVPDDFNPDVLRQAFAAVLQHHDALRLRFSQHDGSWQQYYAPAAEKIPFTIERSAAQEEEAEQWLISKTLDQQQNLNFVHGPLTRLTLLQTADRTRLFWCIHHLAVDGVSWRPLLEDLHKAYSQLVQGQPLSLPLKSSSFKAWSMRLQSYLSSQELADELHFWQALPELPLPMDFQDGKNRREYQQEITVRLEEKKTSTLLREAQLAYNTRINDLLLAALAMTLRDWHGSSQSLIELEGHGRVGLFPELDLSRTTGWFTAMYPVLLDLPQANELGAVIKAVKEQLRRIPKDGISYGLLKELAGHKLPKADIVFNYLGQFDQGIDAGSFSMTAEKTGSQISMTGPRSHLLEINGAVTQGQLSLTWSWSSDCYRSETVKGIAQAYIACLQELVHHCAQGRQGVTPSDFPAASVTQATLDSLFKQYADIQDIYPLTPMQQGLLFHTLYQPENEEYFEQLLCTLSNIDALFFKAAWQLQLERHPILRSAFLTDHTPMLQLVEKKAKLFWQEHDWRELPVGQQKERLRLLTDQERKKGFVVSKAPLIRFDLIRRDDEQFTFVMHFHHVLLDGWSVSRIFEEVRSSYLAMKQGRTPQLPTLPPFREYIAWLQKQDAENANCYWQERLAGFTEPTLLPIQQLNKLQPEYRKIRYSLGAESAAQLQQFCQQQRVTLNTVLQTALGLALARYSSKTDICFGVMISGRNASLAGIEDMVGMLINALPFRLQIDNSLSGSELLQHVQELHQADSRHGFSSLVDIQEQSELAQDEALFETLLAVENFPRGDNEATADESYRIEQMWSQNATSFPLTIMVDPGETADFYLLHDSCRINAESIDRFWGHLRTLLAALISAPEQPVGQLDMLTQPELAQIQQWNAPETGPVPDCTLLDLFERQAAASPDSAALIHKNEQLTYQQLDQQACRLAHCLLAIKTETSRQPLVAVALERSPLMIISVLAALKAGAAYVPVDPDYPAERIQRILEGSGAGSLITHQRVADSLELPENVRTLTAEQLDLTAFPPEKPAVATQPDDLAYIIFTSGSTGLPKGVAISHRGATNTILDINERFAVGQNDRVLALSSLSFDLSVYDIFGLLAAGGAVVMPEQEKAKEPTHWAELASRHQVTVWNSVPALMQIYAEQIEGNAALRLVMMSGDWIPLNLPERISTVWPQAQTISLGGATEASIWSIWHPIDHVDPAWKSIPYGKALRNQSFHILDEKLSPCPLLVPGQLYIGGIGLAQCYWGDEEKTAASFIIHPRTGEHLYRTGDLGRWLPDGSIEFLGRDDFQVKIRGFRIELGEIETAICRHPLVKEATVIAHDEIDGKRLLAYFVPESESKKKKTGSAKGEMSWLNDTVEKILSLKPERLLEISCGIGAFSSCIAPSCQQYIGVDFSQLLQEQRNAADAFQGIENGSVDVIAMNAVIQYFPSVDYCISVLEKAMEAVSPGGSIFIGDIRNFKLLEAFHASVQLHQAEDSLPLSVLRQHIQKAVQEEEELFIDPDLFKAIHQEFPRIKNVQIQLKAGAGQNEMNRFRYDVILRLDQEPEQPETIWLDWQEQDVNLSNIAQLLAENRSFAIKNIPNARLSAEKHLLAQLHNAEGTVKELRNSLRQREQGIDPDELCRLADQANFACIISYDSPYHYAVAFCRKDMSETATTEESFLFKKTWHHFA
ncbi:hypothetical protein GCAAIG_05165 [Candidatus Electronema halotolerans]